MQEGTDNRQQPNAGTTPHPDEMEQLNALFRKSGGRAPRILWSPQRQDLNTPLIRQFAAILDTLAPDSTHIRQADFQMVQFASLQDWLMLVDVEDGGARFRYGHYGAGIAEVFGRSMLGRTSDEFDSHISRFFNAIYRAALARKTRVLTRHEPPKQVFARAWERLIVPLFDSNGDVTQFAVLNVPDNELRPGLEIIPDPVLIVDEQQIVRFANRAAREIFERPVSAMPGTKMDLFTFAGVDLDIPHSPEEFIQSKAIHDVVSLVLCGTLIQRFMLTISATNQRDHAFYVITLRPTFEPMGD